MKTNDLRQALNELRQAGEALHEAAAAADGEVPSVWLASAIVASAQAARKLTRLREQLQGGGRMGGRRG